MRLLIAVLALTSNADSHNGEGLMRRSGTTHDFSKAILSSVREDSKTTTPQERTAIVQVACDEHHYKGVIPKVMHVISRDCTSTQFIAAWQALQWPVKCYQGDLIQSLQQQGRTFASDAAAYNSLYADLLPVQRSDLLRYMVLFNEGGGYADDDVEPFPGLTENFEKHQDADLVVGWERYTPRNHTRYCLGTGSNISMLCESVGQWQFFSKPGSPLLRQLIEDILRSLKLSRLKFRSMDASDRDQVHNVVVETTGPTKFTRYIVKKLHDIDVGKSLQKALLQGIFSNSLPVVKQATCPMRIDMLNVTAFACDQNRKYGQNPSGAPPCDKANPRIWSQHHFSGSWLPA